ncbi:MAG TPA: SDR family oxidoreductase [Pirellulales bacterium]|jgi:hypothetical protein
MDASKQQAIVTGASSGLGGQIARALARRGVDVVVVARRQKRLEVLASEIRRDTGVNVIVMPADLGESDGPKKLFDAVEAAGLQIDILVNNAGLGLFGPFLKQSFEQINQMIALNIGATTALTRLFLPAMKKRKSGYILDVSSFAALQPIPDYSVYSGTKAFIVAFAQALRHELRSTGVSVSVVAPGFMQTEFHDVAHHQKTLLMKMSTVPVRYTARKAVAGMFRRKLLITPGPLYQFNSLMVRLLPRRIVSGIAAATVGGKRIKPAVDAPKISANEPR